MTTTVERKYVLTKVASGDYLLPSNDGKILWRIHSFTEGPSSGLGESIPTDRTFWAIKKWRRALSQEALEISPPNPDDWDQWEHVEEWFDTRAKAIEAALSHE